MIANRNLVIAQGKMAAFVAALLQRQGVIGCEDFGRLLACFAAIVGETEPEQADILMLWAEMVIETSNNA